MYVECGRTAPSSSRCCPVGVRRGAPARCDQHPAGELSRRRGGRPRPRPADGRLLLRLPVRPQRTGARTGSRRWGSPRSTTTPRARSRGWHAGCRSKGTSPTSRRAGAHRPRDVPTCRSTPPWPISRHDRRRTSASWSSTRSGVVLGVVRRECSGSRPTTPVEGRDAAGTAHGAAEHHRRRAGARAWTRTGAPTCWCRHLDGRLVGDHRARRPPWPSLTRSGRPDGSSSATGSPARSTRPTALVEHAVAAEAAGFRTAMISDHFHPWTPEQGNSAFVWTVLGAIATRTTTLRVGTGVTAPIARVHPLVIAHAAATVEILMPGRFFLGLGAGERLNEQVVGQPGRPGGSAARWWRRRPSVIRRLWPGKTVTHQGEHFTVERARLFSRPDTAPPIVVAAGGRDRRAGGRIGDGMLGVAPTPASSTRSRRPAARASRGSRSCTCAGPRPRPRRARPRTSWWPNAGDPRPAARRAGDARRSSPPPRSSSPRTWWRSRSSAVRTPSAVPRRDRPLRRRRVHHDLPAPDRPGPARVPRVLPRASCSRTSRPMSRDRSPADRRATGCSPTGAPPRSSGPTARSTGGAGPGCTRPRSAGRCSTPTAARPGCVDAMHAGRDDSPPGPTARTTLRVGGGLRRGPGRAARAATAPPSWCGSCAASTRTSTSSTSSDSAGSTNRGSRGTAPTRRSTVTTCGGRRRDDRRAPTAARCTRLRAPKGEWAVLVLSAHDGAARSPTLLMRATRGRGGRAPGCLLDRRPRRAGTPNATRRRARGAARVHGPRDRRGDRVADDVAARGRGRRPPVRLPVQLAARQLGRDRGGVDARPAGPRRALQLLPGRARPRGHPARRR